MAELEITNAAQLRDRLVAHHARHESLGLITWKAATPDKYGSREAVLDALIAYGWTDGRRFEVDAQRTAQLISPRRQ